MASSPSAGTRLGLPDGRDRLLPGEIVAWHLEVRCRAREAIALIERAARELGRVPSTLTLGTDNGSALTAHACKAVLPPSGSRNSVLKRLQARGSSGATAAPTK